MVETLRTYARLLGILCGSLEQTPTPRPWTELVQERLKPTYRLINLLDEVADDLERQQDEAREQMQQILTGD